MLYNRKYSQGQLVTSHVGFMFQLPTVFVFGDSRAQKKIDVLKIWTHFGCENDIFLCVCIYIYIFTHISSHIYIIACVYIYTIACNNTCNIVIYIYLLLLQ